MRLGISGQALGGVMDFAGIVRIGKKYGVSDFEIWPMNASSEGDMYAEKDVREIARIAGGEGIRICAVTQGAAFNPAILDDAQMYVDLLNSAVDAAALLGAGIVNHYCYYVNLSETHDEARMERYWRPSIARAKAAGITLALENEAHDGTRTPEGMKRILDHFADPAFRTNFDATNYFHASEEAYPAAYEILRPYIAYVHLKNACLPRTDAGQNKAHEGAPMSGVFAPRPLQYACLQDGAVNIAGLLTRIDEDGAYDGVFTLEPHTTPEYVESFYARESAWLRQLGWIK